MQRMVGVGRAEPSDRHLGEARGIRALAGWAQILQRLKSEVVVRIVVRTFLWRWSLTVESACKEDQNQDPRGRNLAGYCVPPPTLEAERGSRSCRVSGAMMPLGTPRSSRE